MLRQARRPKIISRPSGLKLNSFHRFLKSVCEVANALFDKRKKPSLFLTKVVDNRKIEEYNVH